jgi:hypothetical protein
VETQQHQHQEEEGLDPLSLYQYAIKSPVTRDKYQRRLATFFKFIGLIVIEVGSKKTHQLQGGKKRRSYRSDHSQLY